VDRDARLVFEVVARGLLDFHCVACVLCVEREFVPLACPYPTASGWAVNPR
jgi:hypothetical protein